MTREQAVKWIKFVRDVLYEDKDEEIREALRMAIEALTQDSRKVTQDIISRADAIKTVIRMCAQICDWELEKKAYTDCVIDEINSLPSAEARPTVIQSRTLLPTKDFKEWAKRIREINPNAVVIPCDAEVASAEARPTGEWIFNTSTSNGKSWNVCSECGESIFHPANFCPNCGAKMKGGDSE